MKTSNKLLLGFLITCILMIFWVVGMAVYYQKTGEDHVPGETISETREFPSFHKLNVGGNFEVQLLQAEEQKVVITAGENFLPNVVSEVVDGELRIRFEGINRSRERIRVAVQMTEIEGLDISAGARLIVEGEIRGESLTLNSSSGSRGEMELHYGRVFCDVSSGATMTLTGSAEQVEMRASSGAKVNARGLTATNCKVDASTGSSIRIHVTGELAIDVSSAGKLTYYGEPVITALNTGTGGKVEKK